MFIKRVVFVGWCMGFAFGPQSGSATDPAFTERATEAGVARIHGSSGYSNENYTGGGVVGDFNRDGWQDFFMISGGNNSRPDWLFINNQDGTFTDKAADWQVATIHRGKGASVGDYNGDGWLDIYVTSAGPVGGVGPGHHKLYRNNTNGTFTDVAAAAGVNFSTTSIEDGFGSCFGDYDRDGDLDLFVAGFANSNSGNRLFRNNGDGTFDDVTSASEFFDNTPLSMRSFTPRFVDTDGDWYPDMYLISDFGTGRYFRNDTDGTFTDVTVTAMASQEENGMGGNIGDFNGDGRIDWYVTSIYRPAVGWTGNKLYINAGNHIFSERAALAGVDDGGYGWGCVTVDVNHDGRLDIAETNGDSSAGGLFFEEQAYLWIQNGTGTFDEMAIVSGFAHFQAGRGMANFDYDNDGDQDILIFSNNDRLMLFRNDISGPDANWLRIFLDTNNAPGIPPGGYGSRVTITIDGTSQMRYMTSGDNFLSHSELSAHFGLASSTVIDELLIEWPDETTKTFQNVAANQTLTISPGPGPFGDVDNNANVNLDDLLCMLEGQSGIFDCPTVEFADLDLIPCGVGDGDVNLYDLLALLDILAGIDPCP